MNKRIIPRLMYYNALKKLHLEAYFGFKAYFLWHLFRLWPGTVRRRHDGLRGQGSLHLPAHLYRDHAHQ